MGDDVTWKIAESTDGMSGAILHLQICSFISYSRILRQTSRCQDVEKNIEAKYHETF